MELQKDIRMLSLMHYRMTSAMALVSHAMRCVTPRIRPLPGISMEMQKIEGMKCCVLHPEKTDKGTLLMLHGGAFACPAAPYHLKNASAYAGTGFRVIMPDYPLLPQHPHPEALERIIQLAMSISDLSVIAGDSAGGFLALHTASALRDKPDLMLIYPVVMPGFITASMETFRSAPMWSGRNNEWMVKHYLRGKQVPIPCLKGIGKAFVETAEYDPLHDEGILIREKLMEAGAVTELSETEGTVHGYDILWNRPYVRMLREKRLTWLGSL